MNSPFLLRVSILHYTNHHYVHSRSFTYAKIQIYILPSRPVCSSRFTNSKHYHQHTQDWLSYHQRTPFTMQRSFMIITGPSEMGLLRGPPPTRFWQDQKENILLQKGLYYNTACPTLQIFRPSYGPDSKLFFRLEAQDAFFVCIPNLGKR